MKQCSICQLITEKNDHSPIVYCNKEIVLWQTMEFDLPGYLMIAPREHLVDYTQLPDKVGEQLFKTIQKAIAVLTQKYEARKIYQCCFSEMTPHIHFHLFPRYDWMQEFYDAVHPGIDGVKLFSLVRQKCLIKDNLEKQQSLLEFVEILKKEFAIVS